MTKSIKSVCVFCGSSEGNHTNHLKQAKKLGTILGNNSVDLVYGGGSAGLMGAVANAALANGSNVIGVIPEALEKREVAHKNLSKLIVTKSMHERKATMATLADAYMVMPGGFGTLEELFETITWSQLNIHHKPVILLNIDGYFNKLVEFIQIAKESGFISSNHSELYSIVSSIDEGIEILNDFKIEQPESFNKSLI